MKNLLSVTLSAVLALTLISCDVKTSTPSAEQKQTENTARLLNEANNKIGMPNVRNFQQKKLMRMIYELCDSEKLICYAYLQSSWTGKLTFIGKCYGFGVPFSAQFTNPEEVVKGGSSTHGYWGVTKPQADPNGLYMPTASSATWLMMVDPETQEARPVYFEPTITVSPFPLPTGDSIPAPVIEVPDEK